MAIFHALTAQQTPSNFKVMQDFQNAAIWLFINLLNVNHTSSKGREKKGGGGGFHIFFLFRN